MGVCQARGSDLFLRLHSPSLLSEHMLQTIRDLERCFNLFDAFSHSTVSTGTGARVLSALLPFNGMEILCPYTFCCVLQVACGPNFD